MSANQRSHPLLILFQCLAVLICFKFHISSQNTLKQCLISSKLFETMVNEFYRMNRTLKYDTGKGDSQTLIKSQTRPLRMHQSLVAKRKTRIINGRRCLILY